jgi:16S rRNA (guanine527-N7)-methyltransferase
VPVDRDLLARGLDALSLPTAGSLMDGLVHYAEAIELRNPSLSLVGASGDELVVKHLLDSLAPLPLIRAALDRAAAARAGRGEPFRAATLADIGTGAGLPGLPLALALPEVEVDLVDRMTRRTRFLEGLLAELPVPNARVVEAQVERHRGAYDAVVFRAFRPFERKLFKRVFALCDADGSLIAYKGKADRARAELAEIEGLYSTVEVAPLLVPFLEEERCVLVLRPLRPAAPPRG